MTPKARAALFVFLVPCMVVAQGSLQLAITTSNTVPLLSWNNPNAVLQGSPSITGNWVTITNAPNPYLAPATNSAAFYRLRVDCVSIPGIVSWWTGDGTAADLVGPNGGQLMGAASYAQGEVGLAFNLDGFTGWVDVSNSATLNPTGPFSVECWEKGPTGQSSAQSLIVDKSHGFADGTGWAIQTSVPGAANFFYGIGGPTGNPTNFPYVSTSNSVLDGQWHHLAGVWTGTELQIYDNGVLQQSMSQTTLPANNTRDVEIGRSWGGGTPTRFFTGLIDEVTFYNRALSSNEVQAIFNAGSAGKCKH